MIGSPRIIEIVFANGRSHLKMHQDTKAAIRLDLLQLERENACRRFKNADVLLYAYDQTASALLLLTS